MKIKKIYIFLLMFCSKLNSSELSKAIEDLTQFHERTLRFLNSQEVIGSVSKGYQEEVDAFNQARVAYFGQNLVITDCINNIANATIETIQSVGISVFDNFIRLSMFSFFSDHMRGHFYDFQKGLTCFSDVELSIYQHIYTADNKLIIVLNDYLKVQFNRLEGTLNFERLGISKENFNDPKALINHIESEFLTFSKTIPSSNSTLLKPFSKDGKVVIPFKRMNSKFVRKGYFELLIWSARLYASEKLAGDVIEFLQAYKKASDMSLDDLLRDLEDTSVSKQKRASKKKSSKAMRQKRKEVSSASTQSLITAPVLIDNSQIVEEDLNVSQCEEESTDFSGFIEVTRQKKKVIPATLEGRSQAQHVIKMALTSPRNALEDSNLTYARVAKKGLKQEKFVMNEGTTLTNSGLALPTHLQDRIVEDILFISPIDGVDTRRQEETSAVSLEKKDQEIQTEGLTNIVLTTDMTTQTSDEFSDSASGVVEENDESLTPEQAWDRYVLSCQEMQKRYQEWYSTALSKGVLNNSMMSFQPSFIPMYSSLEYYGQQHYTQFVNLDVCPNTRKGRHNFTPAKDANSQKIVGYVSCQHCGLFKSQG